MDLSNKYAKAIRSEADPKIIGGLVPMVLKRDGQGERSFDLFSLMLDQRIISLSEDVNDHMAEIIKLSLLYLDSTGKGQQDIQMYITSPGGGVYAGLGIHDTMKYVSSDVVTICTGYAMSMGCFLLAAGTPGKRYALPSSTIMAHQPLGGAQGQATDIEITANEILRLKKLLTETMAANCNMPTEEMYKLCERDFYMDAYKAKELGFIDDVVGNSVRQSGVESFGGSISL